ncbi:MAG: hypothetical protein MK240_08565, partial [Opitutales bacterium]|nr:hypothetical protein [Opitutales bacterium]
ATRNRWCITWMNVAMEPWICPAWRMIPEVALASSRCPNRAGCLFYFARSFCPDRPWMKEPIGDGEFGSGFTPRYPAHV